MTHIITSVFMFVLIISQTFLLYVSILQTDALGMFFSLVAIMIAIVVIVSEYKFWRKETVFLEENPTEEE